LKKCLSSQQTKSLAKTEGSVGAKKKSRRAGITQEENPNTEDPGGEGRPNHSKIVNRQSYKTEGLGEGLYHLDMGKGGGKGLKFNILDPPRPIEHSPSIKGKRKW